MSNKRPCVYILANRRNGTLSDAIVREKRVKRWRRAWKLELIEQHNPQWRDLYEELAL